MANEGILSILIWPVYAGLMTCENVEPLDHPEYQRGQIVWTPKTPINGAVVITGTARILVPKGYYDRVVYAHHPCSSLIYSWQKLDHPFDFKVDGVVDLQEITQQDFMQTVLK